MFDSRIDSNLSEDRIGRRFISPGSPPIGGMWESDVKSIKHNLRRVVGDITLDVQELVRY